jgi:hypothetical protein
LLPHSIEARFPLAPPIWGHEFDLGRAEYVEAVHEGNANGGFSSLAVGVSRGYPLAEARCQDRLWDDQSGRALNELNIEILCANSSQATDEIE